MKKIYLASVALALSFGAAHAGDSAFDGAYVGVQGDYVNGQNADIDVDGIGGGAFGGYGKSFGDWYVGGEISVGVSGADGSNAAASVEKKYAYGVAARAGYVFGDKVLGYGIVGWERGKFEGKVAFGDVSEELNGLRVGLGAETFVSEAVSVRTEVNYVDWKDKGSFGGDEWRANVGVGYYF